MYSSWSVLFTAIQAMDLTSEIPRELEGQDLKKTIALLAFVDFRGVTAS